MDAKIVKPYFQFRAKFRNAVKNFHSDFYLIPTVGLAKGKDHCSLLRYPEGAYGVYVQIAFKWLAWEFSMAFIKRNSVWIDHITTLQGGSDV